MRDRPIVLSVAGILGALGLYLALTRDRPWSPPSSPHEPPRERMQMTTDPIPLEPGAAYLVALRTRGGAGAFISPARIASYADTLGADLIYATRTRPAGWPDDVEADWFVRAVYRDTSPPARIARSHGSFLAGIDVVDAWRE